MKQMRVFSALTSAGMAAALLCVMPALSAAAEENRQITDETLTYEIVEGGVKIVAADAGLTRVVIPKDFTGYPILSIGEYAFSDCTGLTDVEIRAALDTIETGAFSECSKLETLNFNGGSVKTIADGAFYDCESLSSINLPETVTEIGAYAFGYCFSLTDLTLPASITAIPDYAFYYDDALAHITIPEGVRSIGGMAFLGCSALTELTIPASMEEILDYAFVSCTALERVTVAAGNSHFVTDDAGALLDAACTTLMLYPPVSTATSYTVADGVTRIAPYAFSGAEALTEITLPKSITELGEGAFSKCKGLTQFDFPENITAITGTLFAETSLSSFTIPEGVTEIGEYAFYSCTTLQALEIPDSVTKIGEVAFFGCTGIHDITVPDSVTEIGQYAFGFQFESAAADAQLIALPDFTLRGGAKSAAKDYAAENGIQFKATGVNGELILIAVIVVLAVLFAAVLIVSLRRKKQVQAELPAAPVPEEAPDPNYTSILADDAADDPFERSDDSIPLSGAERERLDNDTFPND